MDLGEDHGEEAGSAPLDRTRPVRETGPAGSGPAGSVQPTEAHQLVGEGAILLDVREEDEWRSGHAAAARHVPLDRLGAEAFPSGRIIVTVCRSGARSARAAAQLRSAGHTVIDVTGGMRAWIEAGLPVVGDHGDPGTIA